MRDDQEELVGHLLHVASKLAIQEGLDPGYRIVINDGKDARIAYYSVHNCYRTNCFPFAHSCDWWKEMRMASHINCIVVVLELFCMFVMIFHRMMCFSIFIGSMK